MDIPIPRNRSIQQVGQGDEILTRTTPKSHPRASGHVVGFGNHVLFVHELQGARKLGEVGLPQSETLRFVGHRFDLEIG